MSYYMWQWKELDDDRDYIAQQKGYEDWDDMQIQLKDDADYREYLRINGK